MYRYRYIYMSLSGYYLLAQGLMLFLNTVLQDMVYIKKDGSNFYTFKESHLQSQSPASLDHTFLPLQICSNAFPYN